MAMIAVILADSPSLPTVRDPCKDCERSTTGGVNSFFGVVGEVWGTFKYSTYLRVTSVGIGMATLPNSIDQVIESNVDYR